MADPELPDLKKKERERKKAGVAWSWGSGAQPFTGATGGSGAAASAAAAASQAVQGQAAQGLLAGLLARLMASTAGQLALTLGALLFAGGAIGLGYSYWMAAQAPARAGGAPDLGAISSTMRVHGPDASRALEDLSQAARGEIKFDVDKPAPATVSATKTEAAPASGQSDAAPQADAAEKSKPQGFMDRLAHTLSGAKLTSSLGGQFGTRNVFNDAAGAKFGASGVGAAGKLALKGQPKGKLGAIKQKTAARGAATGRALRGNSRRAIGQLKLANNLSRSAAVGSSAEQQQTLANDAFNQSVSQGGAPPLMTGAPDATPSGSGVPIGGSGVVTPPPSGPGPGVVTPPVVAGAPVAPMQNLYDQARDYAKQAGQMKKTSMMLLAVGAALMAIGIALMNTVFGAAIGAVLLALGAMLVGMGIMMLMMANQMAQQARMFGNMIAQQAQTMDAADINGCIEQNISTGGDNPCNGTTRNMDDPNSGAEAARAEGGSTYTIDGGGGSPIAPTGPRTGQGRQTVARPGTGP